MLCGYDDKVESEATNMADRDVWKKAGPFPVQRFFETLALIISQRENVKVTVKVIKKEKENEKVAS